MSGLMNIMIGGFLIFLGLGVGLLALNVTFPGDEYRLLMAGVVCGGVQICYGLYQVIREIIAMTRTERGRAVEASS